MSVSDYRFVYSRHIDGYRSNQIIAVHVRFDGKIVAYNNRSRFIFTGYNLDVKIDGDKLIKKLDKMIDKTSAARYKSLSGVFTVDPDGNLAVNYYIEGTIDGRTR